MAEPQSRRWGYVEFLGLGLILVATAWQVFLVDPTAAIQRDAAFYDVERKLDAIWVQLGPLFDPERVRVEPWVNADSRWKLAGKGNPELASQLTMFTWIRFGLFLIGSVLTLIVKWPGIAARVRLTPR